MRGGKIKVHIADDHKILIEGIIAILNTDKRIEVVGHSVNGDEVIEWFKTNKADILILDINMPRLDGIEVLKRLIKKNEHQKVIMLSSYDDVKLVKELVNEGANGFISKASAGEHILQAIIAVHHNLPYFSDDLRQGLLHLAIGKEVKEGARPEDRASKSLTDREIQVLRLITKGLSTVEIAIELSLSVNTIDTHRKKLLKKLNVKNAVGLAVYAMKNRIM